MPDISGQSLGRYRILELLGEGGMATVYKAFDTVLERDVAVKVIRRELFSPQMYEQVFKRFERETKWLARLSHPNIVKVHDYGEYEGSPYLVLEYLPGGTLRERFKGKLAWQDAVRLILPIARALQFSHQQGIIHRDIKPSNILLTASGEPMLSDFGIAKILSDQVTTTLTGTGIGIGTPEYMAPEQWHGVASPLSDMYSLAAVFYELVTGQKLHTGKTPVAIMLKQATEPLPHPRQFVPNLPEAVEHIMLRALASKPEDRYVDMAAFANALESALTGQAETKNLVNADTLVTKPVMRDSQATIAHVTAVQPVPLPASPARAPQAAHLWRFLFFGALMAVMLFGAVVIGILLYSQFFDKFPSKPAPASAPPLIQTEKPLPTQAPIIATAPPEPSATLLPSSMPTQTPAPTFTEPPPTATIPPTLPPVPRFTAATYMYCREGPGTGYAAPWQLNKGEVVDVIGRWHENPGWLLVDINSPDTRTDCCWVGGDGSLNVDADTLKLIYSLPDRKDCSSVR